MSTAYPAISTACHHGVDRARERCRLCEPDIYQYRQDGAVAPVEQLGPKLDRIIELLEFIVSEETFPKEKR